MHPLYKAVINLENVYIILVMTSPEKESFVVTFNQKVKRYSDMLANREGRRNGGVDNEKPDIEFD